LCTEACLGQKYEALSEIQTKVKRADSMTQEVEHLLSEFQALSSNSTFTKKEKEKNDEHLLQGEGKARCVLSPLTQERWNGMNRSEWQT
jgi:hypothetical protein